MKREKIVTIAAVCILFAIMVFGMIVPLIVGAMNNEHEDTSMSGQLDKAVQTKGDVRIVITEDGWSYTFKMDTWSATGSSYYDVTTGSYLYQWSKYKAHYDSGSVVVERYTAKATVSPSANTDGTLSAVDYYSAANVAYISYTENGIVYTWHR